MKIRTLITGTGQLGVGEGLFTCLELHREEYVLFAANAGTNARALYAADKGFLLPIASDPSYLEKVFDIVRKESVEFLIPGSEPELAALAPMASALLAEGCRLLASPAEVVAIGDNKLDTYRFLSQAGITTPKSRAGLTAADAEELGWPVIVKPIVGGGGKNVNLVKTPEELDLVNQMMALKKVSCFMQEHIGSMDSEFTASALMDPEGRLIGSFAARRTLAGGATASVEVEDFPEVHAAAIKVAQTMGARGPINIQAREHKGGLSIFEINPRFSGSAPFRALCGFNEPHLLIKAILSGSPSQPYEIQTGSCGVRSFKENVYPTTELQKLTDLR